MYRCYNLISSEVEAERFMSKNQPIFDLLRVDEEEKRKNAQTTIYHQLEKWKKAANLLDGDAMQSEWFPNIDAKIFISHSHKDEELALCLKVIIESFGKVPVFLDSVVWGYCNDLLKMIDDKFCKDSNNTYSYKMRNNTTAAVHMMLSNALTQMMDKCECILFLNTKNSNMKDCYGKMVETASPWIYHELSTMKVLRMQIPNRILNEQVRVRTMDGMPQISHKIILERIPTIGLEKLSLWILEKTSSYLRGDALLDSLYRSFI